MHFIENLMRWYIALYKGRVAAAAFIQFVLFVFILLASPGFILSLIGLAIVFILVPFIAFKIAGKV